MTDSPDAIVRRWFNEVWNAGREDAIDRLMAPNALVHGLGEVMIGPTQFKQYFRMMRSTLHDMEVRVVRTVVDGQMVVAHCHVMARHAGNSPLGPATGRTVDFWGMTMARVVDSQLVEGWNCYDFLTMYQQVGWVKVPVAR
jgi:predicted SnoaL-like aldol condensation-catalyzing enzyme